MPIQHTSAPLSRWLLGVIVTSALVAQSGSGIGANPLAPSRAGFSVQSIIESGQRGGMLVPVGSNFSAAYNREMGAAMELWNAHQWAPASEQLTAIYQNHPDSPWAVEARMHVACYCRFNALYDQAEEHFLAILEQCADNEAIRKKVLMHLPDIYYRTGRLRAAKAALELLKEMPLEWNRKQFLENWRLIYFNAIAIDDTLRVCGTRAVALALESCEQGGALRNISPQQVYQKHPWASQPAGHPDGYSLAELAQIGGGTARRITFAELQQLARPGNPVVVYLETPAEPKLFARLNRPPPRSYRKPSGHFVVVEQADASAITVLEPSGGRQLWATPNFAYRWSGLALLLSGDASDIGVAVDASTAAVSRGGCCGSPPPATANGDPCTDINGPGAASGGCPSCNGCGAPIYKWGLPSRNVLLEDMPMWCPDAKGPGLNLQLAYNRTDSLDGALYDTNVNYYPFGHKWSCNFSCFIKEGPDASITAVLPDGRHEIYKTNATGFVAADVRNLNHFAITNGYAQLTFNNDKSAFLFDTNTQHLVSVADRFGNTLQYQYNANHQLTQVTDAAGRVLNFTYTAGCVSQISDALGRACTLGYAGGNLVSITDMGNYATTIAYDTNNWVTQVNYPNGSAIKFTYTDSGDLGAPYDSYTPGTGYPSGTAFRIRATDSLSQTNELFYHSFAGMGPVTITDKAGNAWLYAHDGLAPYTYVYSDNVNARYRGNSSLTLCCEGEQWEHRSYDASGNLIKKSSAISAFKAIIGDANTGDSRDDIATTYRYDTNNWMISATLATNGVVVGVSSNVNDAAGNLLWHRDALGNITRTGYDAFDDPTSVTNALGQVTALVYDNAGHLSQATDARNNTTQWTYDNNGFNTAISFPDGSGISKTPDAIGRVATATDPAGYQIQYTYDGLDRVTQVAFPDSTTLVNTYSCCGLTQAKDRLNRTTYFGYDAIGRRNSISNAAGQVVRFDYHPSDQIAAIHQIMADGSDKMTQFNYISTNGFSRLTSRVAPSGRRSNVYGYNFRGWLTSRFDALQRRTGYVYDGLGRLTKITYPDSSAVTIGHDVLGRVTSAANPYASQSYAYNALSAVTNTSVSLNIPGFASVTYSVAHGYDAVGNLTSLTVTGAQGFNNVLGTSYSYDNMNRLTAASSANASASYSFDSAGRLASKTYGNNDVTSYGYDAESRLTSLGTSNGSSRVQGWSYAYNAAGLITNINDGATARAYTYDAINQLTGESGGGTNAVWTYDAAGNCLTDQESGVTNSATYDADNELLVASTMSVTQNVIRGQVQPGPQSNKWYNTWASSAGRSARVSPTDGSFTIPAVPMVTGSNTLAVTVRDVSGNLATQTVGFTKQSSGGGSWNFYDANGNVATNIIGNTTLAYSYDFENRLIGVTSNGIQLLQCWYDGVGRRIAKKEIVGGATNAVMYVYNGWNVIGVLNQQGQVLEHYTRGAGLGGDIGTIIAETRYSGGTATNTVYYHNNHRGDVTAVRQGTSTVVAFDYAPLGQTRSISGGYCSRFRFSSKERDQAIGLYYYGYRYYAPNLNRWLTQDPLKEKGGLNQFVFCRNNSISGLDPRGLVDLMFETSMTADMWTGQVTPLSGADQQRIANSGLTMDQLAGKEFFNAVEQALAPVVCVLEAPLFITDVVFEAAPVCASVALRCAPAAKKLVAPYVLICLNKLYQLWFQLPEIVSSGRVPGLMPYTGSIENAIISQQQRIEQITEQTTSKIIK